MTLGPALIPIAVLIAVPLWTSPSWVVLAVAVLAGLLGAAGLLWPGLPAITLGASLTVVDYALALSLSAGETNIVAATVFGLALLFLLDLSEFARHLRGAELAATVPRTQAAFWLGRAAVAAAAVALLVLGAALLAYAVPVLGRPVIAGLGAALAFAGAMQGGIVRGSGDRPQ